MHKNAVKYITHEVKMCDLGEPTRMEGRMSCASPAKYMETQQCLCSLFF